MLNEYPTSSAFSFPGILSTYGRLLRPKRINLIRSTSRDKCKKICSKYAGRKKNKVIAAL